MKQIAAVVAFLVLAIMADAHDGDDSLRHYIKKSTLIAKGTISSEIVNVVDRSGVVNYSFSFKWSDILHGEAPPEESGSLEVTVIQFEYGSDGSPLLKKGKSCILFLVPIPGSKEFKSADPWFGIQPDNGLMVTRIKALSKEQK